MAEQEQQQQDPAEDETVQITDLDQFVRLLFAWHDQKVKLLEHMLQVPEGTEVVFGEIEHKLEGDFRQGYLMGLSLALIELGTLPFVTEPETEERVPS